MKFEGKDPSHLPSEGETLAEAVKAADLDNDWVRHLVEYTTDRLTEENKPWIRVMGMANCDCFYHAIERRCCDHDLELAGLAEYIDEPIKLGNPFKTAT